MCSYLTVKRCSSAGDPMHQAYADYWAETDIISDLPYESVLRHNGANRPIYLRIETVNTCNNNCIICAYRDQSRAKSIMPMALFQKAVLDYAEMGGGFLSLTPLVGDILLDRYLSERLQFLRTVPEIRSLGVTTNGAMVHRSTMPNSRQFCKASTGYRCPFMERTHPNTSP